MLAEGEQITAGNPTVSGARVMAEVVSQGRRPKEVVFKYKSKVRFRKRTGHRQPFTRLSIQEIVAPGAEAAPKRSRRKAQPTEQTEGSEGKA